MSNQKITELKSLTAETIDDADLFPVVDVSSNASPTGETKNISVIQIVNRVVNSSIDQINQTLADTARLHHSHSIDDVINLRPTLNTFISSSQIGQPDGVVPLGFDSKINVSYLPDTLSGSNFVRTIFGRTGNVTASVGDYDEFYILQTQVGQANGVAGLDAISMVPVANLPAGLPDGVASLGSDGKIPLSQLPATTTGSFPVTEFNGRTGAIVPIIGDYSSFYLSRSGGTMSGSLNVLITPTQPSHSVSKKYVDDTVGDYLLKSGGTMTGDLNVKILPTQPSHSVSKEYVDQLTSVLNVGILKFSEKSVGGGRQCYDGFACIDKENNVRVVGNNAGQRFGELQANGPAVTLNLPSNRKAEKVYANRYNVFIISTTGYLYATGRNTYGQCGVASSFGNNLIEPTLTDTPRTIVKVAFSTDNDAHSYMFLTSDGEVYSCGNNTRGQLGNGTTSHTNGAGPKLVLGPGNTYGNPTLPVVDVIGAGGGGNETFIALLNNGSVYCVGYGGYGQMGNGTTTVTNSTWKRVKLPDDSNIADVTEIQISGRDNTTSCYARVDGPNDLYSWGYNVHGQLGLGNTSTTSYATKASGAAQKFWTFGSIGQLFVKHTNGDIYACGYNAYGQLGVGDTSNKTSLTLCSQLSGLGIEDIYSGNHSNGPSTTWAKVGGSNSIYATGYNGQYQLGNGGNTQRTTFGRIDFRSNSNIVDIDSEYFNEVGGYTMILTEDGNIYHTGQSRWGLGSYTNSNRNFFSKVTNFLIG